MTISGWSKNDEIRWVEQRLRERVAKEAGKIPDDLDAQGVPERTSLELWLAKERDGLSWQQVANKYYPYYRRHAAIKSAGISKARRAYASVQRALEPSVKESFRRHMDATIRTIFNCTPEDFKWYLNSIRLDRRGK